MKPTAPHKASSFLSGVSLLTLSALIVKIIGLCYRIPLSTERSEWSHRRSRLSVTERNLSSS